MTRDLRIKELREVIDDAIALYNKGSDNEEYLRGQRELAKHIFEYYKG